MRREPLPLIAWLLLTVAAVALIVVEVAPSGHVVVVAADASPIIVRGPVEYRGITATPEPLPMYTPTPPPLMAVPSGYPYTFMPTPTWTPNPFLAPEAS